MNTTTNFSNLITRFDLAFTSGIAFPKIRIKDNNFTIKLHRSGQRSKYPGSIQIIQDNTWIGRIHRNGQIQISSTVQFSQADLAENAIKAIMRLENDFELEVIYFGRSTGNCCFCNKKLNNEISVELGYGPVCAEKFGLYHSYNWEKNTEYEKMLEATHILQ